MIREILLIGIGGFIGAVLRYLISGLIPYDFLPLGTLIVNMIGSFIIGFLMFSSLFLDIPMEYKLLIGTGFCGALTTFSTFSYETFYMIDEGLFLKAFINIILNVSLCLIMVFLGRTLAILLIR
ncbi:camphor resistance protein CrcB [Methanocaldococcus villosus KIN24-T80]|uniref:Fluoride-specific ion channel FluC n=1 Tax=Methanocaldococcus villosus KIN24-T80 TaxID=1069083 RepID=N6UVK4_9EURY|nr:fluoride efflux transporter CrcB [Methanocaldococcus villosus]ENN96379.1 camphor resistance protein CrcB [Methanocaldococcus villosus KIN24-T80]